MTEKKTATPETLTAYAEDQMRRLREFVSTPIMTLGGPSNLGTPHAMCVTAQQHAGETIPAIWLGLEESGHVIIERPNTHEAWVRPA